MTQFDQLTAFVKVAELGSYTRAAEALDLSRTLLSRRVMALEESLGARLIQRTTRRLHLTEAGENTMTTTLTTQASHLHATALLRISLGIMTLAHGLLKVFVFTLPGTVGYFESLGLPGFLAYLTIAAEVGGGLALLLGIYTRWVSLALVPVLLGAAWVHIGNGWLFSNPGGGWEFPVFWAIALVVQAGLGSGSLVVARRFA